MVTTEGVKRDIVVVGASLGGVSALRQLFRELPRDFGGSVVAVLHRGAFRTPGLLAAIGREAQLPVLEPDGPVAVASGTLYIAPRDRHLVFRDHRLEPHRGAKEHFTRPAIDPLFRSAAEVYGPRVVGLILTGGGWDGVGGLVAIKSSGGLSLAQDPDEAEAPTMPERAIKHDNVDLVLSLSEMAAVLVRLAAGQAVERPRVGC